MKDNPFPFTAYRSDRVLGAAILFSLVVFSCKAPTLLGQATQIVVEAQNQDDLKGNVEIKVVIDNAGGPPVQVQAPFNSIIRIGSDNPTALTPNAPQTTSGDELRPDRLELFDGSVLHGELQGMQAGRSLIWKHPAAIGPVRFQYAAAASISLEGRSPPKMGSALSEGLRCLLQFRNGDSCYGNLIDMNDKSLFFQTAFAGKIKAPRETIESLLALPESFESLYDLSQGMKEWKLPNQKSWKQERGQLMSTGSGYMGRDLPRKENISLACDLEWNRSFYFNIRLFAKNAESTSYNNDAYNLSFSNSRVNLTASKQKAGRVSRQTIGSVNLSAFHQTKNKARIVVTANRKTKTFIIAVDGSRVARWQDTDEDQSTPKGDALLLYNQGGSSQIKISNLSITGWDGDFEPSEDTNSDPSTTAVTFVNGDATNANVGNIVDGKLEVRSSAGDFSVPIERVRRISFAAGKISEFKPSSDHAWLAHGIGHLSLAIKNLDEGKFNATSPIFGDMSIDQQWLRRIDCNRHLIEIEQYLTTLRLAERAIAIRNFPVARDALLKTKPHYRGWQWGRLFFHLLSQDSEEVQRFPGHDSGMDGASFSRDGKFFLSGGRDGGHRLMDVATGKVTREENGLDIGFPRPEIGRYPNELQHQVHISRDFWMSEFEITHAQYVAIIGETENAAVDPNLPVSKVSWNDALEFCRKLNIKNPPPEGYLYRLPTTAEWEYACRAGGQGPYAGTRQGELRQAADYLETLDELGWFSNNANGVIHPVGKKKPNAYGLHDMHGNVWEWCLDHVEQNKGGMLGSCRPGANDPLSLQGEWRALRGGCFAVGFNRCRSAYRGANAPEVVRADRGFRIVLAPDLEKEKRTPEEKALPIPPTAALKADEKRVLKNPDITLVPIPSGSFLMGSPGSLSALRVAMSSNGQLLAHVNLVGKIEVVRLSDKSLVTTTSKLPSPANAIDLSPNGKLILTGSSDGIARLWNATSGQLIHTCEGHSASIASVAFAPNGKDFATGGIDGSCRLWNVETGKSTLVIKDPEARFLRLSFAPDGKSLLTSGPGAKPVIWDCKNGKKVLSLQIDPEQITSARFFPHGSFAAVSTRANRIHLCELINGLSFNVIRQNAGEIADLSFSPDGSRLITTNLDNICRVHRVPLGWSILVFDQNGKPSRAPDYYFNLTASSRTTGKTSGLFLDNWLEEQNLKADATTQSSDGKWTLTHSDGTLRLWRTESGSLHAILADKLRAPIAHSAFSPDGRLAVAQLKTGEILAYPSVDWSTSQPEQEWTRLLQKLGRLDAEQARAWLKDASTQKLQ